MAPGTTVTCAACGHHGFVIVNARTGEPVDLKTYLATIQRPAIDPSDLARHDPLDMSELRMVCANPRCRQVLG
ncbi:MAG TPA: hypothetical protein VIG30_08155 [Ktedonobacterales bacterium]|jgi:hypothetical protein